ncbi:MAG: hypothetical protein CMK09_18455 [Ponticaulis sp.]|nr:hypothetical protein [Ponticaulis sp.]|tara:strand:+ start:61307 stop:62341 length:1035 start_codon:yes stop_codon:yes gene_type:complete
MTVHDFSAVRNPRPLDPTELRVCIIDDSGYSRAILKEVLRGVGVQNDNMVFLEPARFFDDETISVEPDVILVIHANDTPPDFDFIRKMRRLDNPQLAELPLIFLSSLATQSNIIGARDAGADEFMARPVSSSQLHRKIKKVIEAPQPFVSSPNYVGPCRRRKTTQVYTGPRRRLDDFKAEKTQQKLLKVDNADPLVQAITELRAACGELSDERKGLITRVRDLAISTMRLARETDDKPLFQTATAVKYYLDGVGASHSIEPHVLETGINALTQLSTLPGSYDTARASVASLMTFAVRKKLAHYQKRRDSADPDVEETLRKINEDSGANIEFEDKALSNTGTDPN